MVAAEGYDILVSRVSEHSRQRQAPVVCDGDGHIRRLCHMRRYTAAGRPFTCTAPLPSQARPFTAVPSQAPSQPSRIRACGANGKAAFRNSVHWGRTDTVLPQEYRNTAQKCNDKGIKRWPCGGGTCHTGASSGVPARSRPRLRAQTAPG